MYNEIKHLRKKIENHQSIVNLKDNKALLQKELLWAKVRDTEDEIDQENATIGGIQKKLNECKENVEKRNENIVTLQELIRFVVNC